MITTPHARLLAVVGGDYDIDYSGLSIRGDQDIGTTTLERDSTVQDGSGTSNRDLWNDVTYAEYSKITTLQTREWTDKLAFVHSVSVTETTVMLLSDG